MTEVLGYDVRHLPCGHERFIEGKSVRLALLLRGAMACLECDTLGDFEVLSDEHMGIRRGLDDL